MKLNPFVLLVVLTSVLLLCSQGVEESVSQDIVVAPITARILGKIPDGTPPPPTPPKPKYIVDRRDILDTTTHEQGGRTITIQQIKPITLPPPPPPPTQRFFTPEEQAEFQAKLDAYHAQHPRSGLLMLSASVFRSKDSQPRTWVHYWSEGGRNISFWSSADFGLIAGGVQSFMDSAGETHSLIMGWGYVDIDRMSKLRAAKGLTDGVPEIPEFPEGKATWQVIGEKPDAEDLATIQALHDIYNNEHDRLLSAFHGREQARLAREAELKANPPKPKNLTLNFWRIEKPVTTQKGDAQ